MLASSPEAKTCARIAVLTFAFLALSCLNDRLDPVIPAWDTDFTIPLVNRTFTMLDLVQHQPASFSANGAHQVIFSTEIRMQPDSVREAIALDPIVSTQFVRLGVFRVFSPGIAFPVPMPWIAVGLQAIRDTIVSYPALTDTLNTFVNVSAAQGVMTLTIKNNLPVPITILDPLVLSDRSGVVATFVFVGGATFLPPGGGSSTASFSIAGETIDHIVSFSGIRFHISGSDGPVAVPARPPLEVSFSINNFKVRTAVLAQVPPQRLTNNDSTRVELNDSTIVKDLIVRRGTLNLSFNNRINLGIMFLFRFNEILRPGPLGYAPFEDSLFLAPLAADSRTINLSGFRIRSQSGGLVRSIAVVSSMVLPTGSASTVTVNDTDKVEVSLARGSIIVADSAVGILKPTWITVDAPAPFRLGDLPTKLRGSLSIPTARLKLRTFTSIGFPLDMHIRIAGINPVDRRMVYLDLPATSGRIQPGSDSIAFDQSAVGSFLSQFSGHFPDSIRIIGRILVNPPDAYQTGSIGSVSSRGIVGGSVQLEIPLRLRIDSTSTFRDTVVIGDTAGNGFAVYTVNKNRINGINYGALHVDILNATPVQVEVNVKLLDNLKQSVLIIPQPGTQPIIVNAGVVDADGNVTVPTHSTAVVSLTGAEVRTFNPAEYLAQTLTLRAAGNALVQFRTSDYVRIRLWSDLSYRVNK